MLWYFEGENEMEARWPYPDCSGEIVHAQIALVERSIKKYVAAYAGFVQEVVRDGCYLRETLEKHIWKWGSGYLRADRIYLLEKPFLVLEFSDKKEGAYEDADPIPYDLSEPELERVISFALGIEAN